MDEKLLSQDNVDAIVASVYFRRMNPILYCYYSESDNEDQSSRDLQSIYACAKQKGRS